MAEGFQQRTYKSLQRGEGAIYSVKPNKLKVFYAFFLKALAGVERTVLSSSMGCFQIDLHLGYWITMLPNSKRTSFLLFKVTTGSKFDKPVNIPDDPLPRLVQ